MTFANGRTELRIPFDAVGIDNKIVGKHGPTRLSVYEFYDVAHSIV